MRYLAFLLLLVSFSANADFALVEPSGRVAQIAAQKFPVHSALRWIDLTGVSPTPMAGWTYDEGLGFVAPPVPEVRKPTVISYEAFQNRFTAAEFNAATDYVYETDTATGKPKRRGLIQGLSRAIARNAVDLNDARTVAFVDALVAGGIISAQRKSEVLAP